MVNVIVTRRIQNILKPIIRLEENVRKDCEEIGVNRDAAPPVTDGNRRTKLVGEATESRHLVT